MHELSICNSIADIVRRHAGERPVEAVHLRVGQLRQIVPDTLTYCWSLVSAQGPLAGARLEVEHIPGAISCHDCGQAHEIGAIPVFVCQSCASTDVEVTRGEEFLITSLDLAEQ